jgi:hypothetical protein
MGIVDFNKFSEKILSAASGKLSPQETGTLKRMLSRVKKRNRVLAAGLLSALKAGGAGEMEITNLSTLLERANYRILDGQTPFTEAEGKQLAGIFKGAHLPEKAQSRFRYNIDSDQDELLASEIANSIHMTTSNFRFVPEKKEEPTTQPAKKREATSR